MFETESLHILYGVQATGNGHISRSREMITALKQRGHKVDVILSGRPADELWDMQSFEPYQVMQGLTFKTQHGRVQNLKTLLAAKPVQLIRDIRAYDPKDVDLVITDYEPITSRIARKYNIPSLGIGHQYAFNFPIPKKSFNPLTRTFMNSFAPADLEIGLHWNSFGNPILPPIIPTLDRRHANIPQQVLVYLPFEDIDALLKSLLEVYHLSFILYSNDLPPASIGNVSIKALSREGFHEDLVESEAVFCNAGFELPSEALSLGKKLLVKPLKGQPEQESNGLALQKLKAGSVCSSISRDEIKAWYESQSSTRIVFPFVVPELVDWIEWGEWDMASLGLLSERLWRHTRIEHQDTTIAGSINSQGNRLFESERQGVMDLRPAN